MDSLMNVFVGNNIVVENYTKEVEQFFSRLLVFDNPEYYKKLNSGRWIGLTPKEIVLYERYGRNLILPFGMLPKIFENRNWFEKIVPEFCLHERKFQYGSRIKPYDYQELAIVASLSARQGIVVAPCGSGKTQIGLEIAARLKGRALWLTHTHDLLTQSIERAKSVFSLKDNDYGIVSNGKVELGNVLTFATVQTLSNVNLDSMKDYFDVIIVDEAHHVVGSPTKLMMFWKVISRLSARYKYGLTATPKRSDGLTQCMFALIGPMCYEVPADAVKDRTCDVEVEFHKTDYKPVVDDILLPDGSINYSKLITDVTENDKRNRQIASDICSMNGSVLVLTDRVKHAERLRNLVAMNDVSCVVLRAISGKKAREERKKAIDLLNDGKVKVLIATFALAKEGLDVPSLRNVVFATPQKNESIVTQSAGRVARKADGKDKGILHDYEDDFGIFNRWQKRRNSVYRKLGYIKK